MRTTLLLSAALLAWPIDSASAQCPDGTAPPCAAARRAAVQRATPSPEARARRFLLLPFRNVTRGPAQEWLVTGAPLMLGSALGQFRDLSVVPDERLTAARRLLRLAADSSPDATQLKRLAEETDGWTAVTGNVFATGARLRITVQALDIATSKVLTSAETQVAADADPRDAFDRLSVRLLEAAGVPGAATDVRALTTNSVDAYRAYVQGVGFYERSAVQRAQSAFLEAVRLDSTFALAWAKLSLTAVATSGFQVALDPTSLLYRAAEKAAQNAGKLPPRQAQLVRSIQAWVNGQIGRAAALADSLIESDPLDLDAVEWWVPLSVLNPRLDTTVTPPRLLTSWNHVVRVGRDAVEQDPGRRAIYQYLVYIYSVGAGFLGGTVGGRRQDPASIVAMLMTPSDVVFIPVLRDSIEFVLQADFNHLPLAERTRLQRRSADAAMEWVRRWEGAGPDDGEAHLWGSRIAEMQDNPVRSLREVTVAESLGVESKVEDLTGRRLALLVQIGQYSLAGRIADSLVASGALASRPFRSGFDRRRSASAAALLLDKRWDRAAQLSSVIGPVKAGDPACTSLRRELVPSPYVGAPEPVRRAVMDTASRYLAEMKAVAALAPCADTLAKGLVRDSVTARQ